MKTWKVQKFASDVVYDIRSRGLLPVVALLAVGLVVAPIVISRGGSSSPPSTPDITLPGVGEDALRNEPAVLTYNPGVRDYRERLDELRQKDPFVQQFATAGAAAQLQEPALAAPTGGGGGAVSAGSSLPTGTGGSGGSSVGPATSPSSGSTKVFKRYFYYEVDVLLADSTMDAPKRRNNVEPLSFLPSEQEPVLVFLGFSRDGKKTLFMVSDEAAAVPEQKGCTPSVADCELLVMREGDKAIFTYAPTAKAYSLKIVDIELKFSKKLPKG